MDRHECRRNASTASKTRTRARHPAPTASGVGYHVCAEVGRAHRCDRDGGECRAHDPGKPAGERLRRRALSGESEAADGSRCRGISAHRRRAGQGRSRAHRDTCRHGAGHRLRVRRCRRDRSHHHLRRIQRDRRQGAGAGAASPPKRAAWRDAHHRSELPRRDAPARGPQCDFRGWHGTARQRRIHFAERRALHRDPRLELLRKRRLQRVRVGRLDARCRLGRSHLLARRRSAHAKHRHLHGGDRRRARVPLRGARGGAHEADHRHQGRPHGAGGARGGFAYRLAHRQR